MPEVYIRQSTEQDIAPIYELVPKIGRLTRHTPYTYWNLFTNFGNTCFVALDPKNQHIGFITSHPTTSPANEWFIWQAGILPDYRGTGLIDGLQDRVVVVAQKFGAIALTTSIEADNPQSFGAFARLSRRLGTEMYEIDKFNLATDNQNQASEILYRIPLSDD